MRITLTSEAVRGPQAPEGDGRECDVAPSTPRAPADAGADGEEEEEKGGDGVPAGAELRVKTACAPPERGAGGAPATDEGSPAPISSPKEIIEFIARERSSGKAAPATEPGAGDPGRTPLRHQASFEKKRTSGLSTETTSAPEAAAASKAAGPGRAPPAGVQATPIDGNNTPMMMGNTPVLTVGVTPMGVTPGYTPGLTPGLTQVNTGSYGNTPTAMRSGPMTPIGPHGMTTPAHADLGSTYDCFISYKHSDFGKAQILQNQLEKLGYRVGCPPLHPPPRHAREAPTDWRENDNDEFELRNGSDRAPSSSSRRRRRCGSTR